MRTEIVYEGFLLEKRKEALENLRELVVGTNIDDEIRGVEKMIMDRERFRKEVKNSHVFFDIVVYGTYYPIIAVGNYGIAVVGNINNPVFKVKNRRVTEIKKAEDILHIKSSIFSVYKNYEDVILKYQTVPTIVDVIGREYELDFAAFSTSQFWKTLKMIRDNRATDLCIQPHLMFTMRDAFEYVRLFPSKIETSINIDPEYQKIILNYWLSYIGRKSYE